ncbi:MAG: Arc family DNA-binding protein [Verrucomicrobia bacterium]|nr:Arc family DNA-binding protein [Verrucomicrobiota bacterium]
MPTLVIKSFPEELHSRLKETASAHRRSVTQETIHLLEKALLAESSVRLDEKASSYWAKRKLLPEFEKALQAGAFNELGDSTEMISEERDIK